MLERRGFLKGLGLIICAPAIVRASSLMPVHSLPEEFLLERADIKWGGLNIGDVLTFPNADDFGHRLLKQFVVVDVSPRRAIIWPGMRTLS